MSETKTIGRALSGEFTANGLLNLFRYVPPKYRIPTDLKKRRKQK
jgi:hypothetical protein